MLCPSAIALITIRHTATQLPKAKAVAAARSDPRAPLASVHRRDLLGGLIHEYELAPAA
jgi:hypothetical protein